MTAEGVAEGMEKWKLSVVGFTLGYTLPYSVIKKFVDTRWQELGHVEIISLKNGVFLFKLLDKDAKDRALEQSSWPQGSKMLFLRPWALDLSLRKEDFDAIPVWIRLPDLKLHYYTTAGLSKFASCIGPLFTDQQTADQSEVAYARIIVELKVDGERPAMIPYINEFGHLTHQLVEYEWVPDSRSKRKIFGHTINKCPLNPRMIAKWVPKQDPSNTVSSKVEEETAVVEEDCGTTGNSSEVLEVLESMDGGKTECIMVEPTLISEIQMVELSSVCKGQANGSVFGNAEQFQPTGTF